MIKTIVWDVDDILNNLMKDWFEMEWKLSHPKCKLNYNDLKENPPYKILGISKKEYLESLDKFRFRHYIDLKPNKEVYEWFEENGEKFKHLALTSTPIKSSPISSAWVMKNYGKWIRGYFVLPSFRKGEKITKYHKNKGEFLKELKNVDLFIDDSAKTIKDSKSNGINSILFPTPWNDSKLTIKRLLENLK